VVVDACDLKKARCRRVFYALVADSAEEVRVSPPNPCEFCFLKLVPLAVNAFDFEARHDLRVANHFFPVDTGDSRLL
jgi:hypothetical protein